MTSGKGVGQCHSRRETNSLQARAPRVAYFGCRTAWEKRAVLFKERLDWPAVQNLHLCCYSKIYKKIYIHKGSVFLASFPTHDLFDVDMEWNGTAWVNSTEPNQGGSTSRPTPPAPLVFFTGSQKARAVGASG